MLFKGLAQNNVKVHESNEESDTILEVNKAKYFLNFASRGLKLLKKVINSKDFDIVIVGYPGYESVFQIKRLTKKPIIYDPFISSYISYVHDYQFIEKNSLYAKFYYYIDHLSFKQSDLILADTLAHAKTYSKLFSQNMNKFERLFVGTNPDLFYPMKYNGERDKFIVGFIGSYIPLHGVSVIVEAAKILKKYSEIKFELIGGTHENNLFRQISNLINKENLDNIELTTHIPLKQLPEKIAKSDIQLGIFGGTLKSKIVIPNKVYSALAMKKPIITSDSIATKELLTHKKNAYLCKNEDADSLAKAIITLYEDKNLRESIAQNGYDLFKEKLTPQKLGNILKNIILKLI